MAETLKVARAELVGVFGDPVDENPTGIMQEAAFAAAGLWERAVSRPGGTVTAGGAWIWRDARTKLPTPFHAGLFLVAGAAVADRRLPVETSRVPRARR